MSARIKAARRMLMKLNPDLLVDELSDPNVCDGGGVVTQEVNVGVDDVHVAIVTKSFHCKKKDDRSRCIFTV